MKILCLATLLLVGYSSLAQIKSFDDLRGIDSEEAFIRVCLENGYENYSSSDDHLFYEYVKDIAGYTRKDTIIYTEAMTILGRTFEGYDTEYKKGRWYFEEHDLKTKRKNNNSYYDKILAEVKNECTLLDIALEQYVAQGTKWEVLIYECPAEGWFTDGVKFKGKLAFRVAGDCGIIEHRLPD